MSDDLTHLESRCETLKAENDELRAGIAALKAECDALRAELLSIGDLDKRHAIVREWGLSEWADWAQNRARYAARETVK